MFNWLKSLLNEHGMATLSRATKTNWDASVPEYWDKAIMYEADRDALFGDKLTGSESSDAAVIEKEDLLRNPGDQIDFTVLRRLIGAGQTGNSALQGNEENIVNGVFSVSVNEVRHATAADHIATVEAIFDFQTSAQKLIAGWLKRYLDDQILNQVLNTDTNTTIYAGGKTARASLGPGDLFLPHELRKLHMAAYRRGVEPFRTMKGQVPFPIYGCALSSADYYQLVNDTEFRQDVRLAQTRGEDNSAISGQVDMYQGAMLYVVRSVNNGDGLPGSYLRPEARLGVALSAAGTTITTGVASNVTGVNYNKYLLGTGTILIDSEQITLGTVDTASSITSVTRAAGGTSGVTHAAGALITQNNLGRVLFFGKGFMMRAWAERPTKISQKYDYEQEWGLGIRFINGVKSVLWNDSTVGKALVMETYAANPSTV